MTPTASTGSSGIVQQILLSVKKGGAISSVAEVQALAGRGLVGDRHLSLKISGSVDKNLTLIEAEKIADFTKATGIPFTAKDARRNVVTSGIELNPLLGSEFFVGSVRVRALELCEPCSLLAKRTYRAVLWGLVHKGGLRCQIFSSGLIRVGDGIRLVSTNE